MDNLIKCLNEYLSDLKVFACKLQNYHWNVEGKEFFQMHEKLEEYYNSTNNDIDEIAESILMLGGQPVGSLKDFMDNTKIVEAKNEKISSCMILDILIQDFNILLEKVIKIKEEADSNKVYLISTLMDDAIKIYSKNLWMLNQTKTLEKK